MYLYIWTHAQNVDMRVIQYEYMYIISLTNYMNMA